MQLTSLLPHLAMRFRGLQGPMGAVRRIENRAANADLELHSVSPYSVPARGWRDAGSRE